MKNGLRKEEIEHFRDNSKKPEKAPDYQPKNPKKQPMPTHPTSSLLPLTPT